MSNVEKGNAQPSDLVVAGSSAGGVEALSILVSTLPMDFPAPLVIAQHLDPNRPSSLHLILQRRTKLVVEIVTNSTTLQAGHIYVVPSNRHVSIQDHHVDLQEGLLKRPRPSVDTLLSSAAAAYGDHLIAVILTGSGSDGASGAIDVKAAGGTVIVQDPQTARYPSMPLSLPPTVVDFEATVERIGPLLYDLLTGVHTPPTEEHTEDILQEILERVSHHASIDFRPYKTSTILRRIGRRMTVTHCLTMREYAEYLKVYPEEIGELVKAFLINVTQFFRDADAFAYLKSDILPMLIERARERDRVLRFWTAGCATGEEPYSLAMHLTDLLGAELPEWSVKIFATDLDEVVITFARRGLYSESLLKGMPIEYRDRFFERVDHGYRISKTLRQMVIFGQQDLSRSAPFPRIDLVLCRNVLIYFTPELQDYVLNQFAFSLSPSGYLFLGKAETVRPVQSFYELVNKHWKVYRCVGNALPARENLSTISTLPLERRPMNHVNRSLGKLNVEQDLPPLSLELGQLRRFNELLLRFLPLGVVIIDRSYRILTANGVARRLLGLRDVANEQDFLHAVRGIPYHEMRTAIDAAFREHSFITLPEVELEANAGGNGRFISLSIALMQLEAGMPDLAAVSVTDVTEQVQVRRQLENIQIEQSQLMQELGTTNKRLSDVNKELMDANEELQVANEELLLTHEELQASIEEFETTNEELQATNEELETNNEELQATNEELETTNDELRARTGELQELTTALEGERVRLTEIVELAPFYILVLSGPRLIVEVYNPRYAPREGHVIQGRPLDEVVDLFWEPRTALVLAHLAREAYVQDTAQITQRMLTEMPENPENPEKRENVDEKKDRFFSYTLIPSHDATKRVNSVIIYAIDETEQHTREAEEERERLKIIFDNTKIAALALYDAYNTTLMMCSPRYLELLTQAYEGAPIRSVRHTWREMPLLSSQEQATQYWKAVIEDATSLRIPETTYTYGQQESSVWDYSLTPIMNNDHPDQVRYLLISAVEITEQVRVRKELEQMDYVKDGFLSLATHELRTPLTSIQANTQMLQRTLKKHMVTLDTTLVHEHHLDQGLVQLEHIVHQVGQMNKLIGEVLDVTRIREGLFELHLRDEVNLVALIRRVSLQQVVEENSIQVHTEDEEREDILLTVDEDRIEQVLNNLLTNALRYSPPGKPVRVTIERCQESHEAVVSVHDEGPGIAEEEQAHLFERFYRVADNTEHSQGLGLGLYIAHNIVTQHGGRIWLTSKPNEGSTFFFALPLPG